MKFESMQVDWRSIDKGSILKRSFDGGYDLQQEINCIAMESVHRTNFLLTKKNPRRRNLGRDNTVIPYPSKREERNFVNPSVGKSMKNHMVE